MPQIKPSSRFRRKAMLETIPFIVIMFATFWREDALPEPAGCLVILRSAQPGRAVNAR